MTPKISVIVPVYNKEIFIEQCIQSILAQSYSSFELILVDDGSTDLSLAICKKYEQDGRVRVIEQKNGGPTKAVETGMKVALGNYYMFVDGDDYISPEMLEKMVLELKFQKGEIICCDHVLEKKYEKVEIYSNIKPGVYENEMLRYHIKDKLLGLEERIFPMSRCMKLFEKSLFEGNEKYYDYSIRMGDDFNLVYPAIMKANRIVIMNHAPYYYYRYVDGSLVHGYSAQVAPSVNNWYKAMQRIIADLGLEDAKISLDREYCYMLLYVMKNELRNHAEDYWKNIQNIFLSESIKNIIQKTKLPLQNRKNQLLYFGIKHPNHMVLSVLHKIVSMYDK